MRGGKNPTTELWRINKSGDDRWQAMKLKLNEESNNQKIDLKEDAGLHTDFHRFVSFLHLFHYLILRICFLDATM